MSPKAPSRNRGCSAWLRRPGAGRPSGVSPRHKQINPPPALIPQQSALKPGILILLALLLSCRENPPISQDPSAPESNSALAAAQFALAKNHLANAEKQKAIPYLAASLSNDPSPETQSALDKILASTDFALPVIELCHPFPILRFKEAEKNLFVAIGGEHPTVIRWNMTDDPSVQAVMFPTEAHAIPHLTVSPDSKFIIVHRDQINLICHAGTLKPITALDAFAQELDPETCQPFSKNGLLFAHPTSNLPRLPIWSIHDSNTGHALRSETFSGKSTSANFEGTNLRIAMADGSTRKIPLAGNIEIDRSPPPQLVSSSPRPGVARTTENTLTITRNIRLNTEIIPTISSALLTALSGYTLDPVTQNLTEIPTSNRLKTLSKELPGRLPEKLRIYSAEAPLTRRLADAYPENFPELTAADRAQVKIIEQVFATRNRAAILALIDTATHGLPFATALYHAIDSQDAEFISRALTKNTDIPHTLKNLAQRSLHTDTDLDLLRQTEDWHGYESPDFYPLLVKLRAQRAEAISTITLPEYPDADDIAALSLRLVDPAILEMLGKPLVAEKALTAARILSENPEHAATALRLADFAERLGSHPSACLRVRAASFATLTDFVAAHTAWIDLITHQPEETHLPSDYTEAAYTAFETRDPRQAIEILNTGLFRFPNNPSSAIRSGWIALLTDHNEDALRYLNHATKLGLPPAEIESTTALLAIAHQRLGDHVAAVSHHAQLTAISPKWEDAEALVKLSWPESFKTSLNAILLSGAETEPWPLPESDPTDTAPRPEGFPIEEPPLPSR